MGEKRKISCKINKGYIPLKLIYFFFMAGEASAMLYRSVFMRHLGMSTKQTGIIWTLERIASVILPPLLGVITDKTRRPKLVLMILLVGGGCTLFSMYFIPQEEYVASGWNSTVTEEEISKGNISFCWSLDCNYFLPHSTEQQEEVCFINNPKRDQKHCHSDFVHISTLACYQLSLNDHATHPKPNYNGTETVTSLGYGSLDSVTAESLLYNASDSLSKCSVIASEPNFTSPVLILTAKQADQAYFSLGHGFMYITSNEHDRLLCVDYDVISDNEKSTMCNKFVPNDVDEYGLTFWLLITIVLVSSFASIGSYPIMETSVLAALGPEKRHKFGNQRLWASIGFGSAALIVGYLKDKSAESIGVSGTNQAFLSMFMGVLICWSCASVVASKLPIRVGKKTAKVRLKDMKQVLKRWKALAFFGLLFFYGADNAVQEVYLFWLAEVKLNAPSAILGASTFVGALLDIPFCLAAGSLIKKFGHAPLICFGVNMYGLRLILCSLVTEPWQLIATESLRCITWGLTWVVMCSYTAKISPKGLETSTMGLSQGILWGVGYSAGALLGGVLFQSVGGDNVFLLFGVASICAAMLFGIFSFFSRTKTEDANKNKGDESIKLGVCDESDCENNNVREELNGDDSVDQEMKKNEEIE